jgi:adenylosuccinate synthase
MSCYMISGMSYGDEGKGSIVHSLVEHTGADLVIRYNGGAQCAHNVVLPDGTHHTFAQFGSGSFVPGVKTYLSRFVLINPVSMMVEAEALAKQGVTDIWERTYVDGQAIVITPFQRALNRLQEMARGKDRHGSTGMGVGMAWEHKTLYPGSALVVEDLLYPSTTRDKLAFSQCLCKREAERLNLPAERSIDMIREFGCINSDTTIPWYLDKYSEWIDKMPLGDELPPSDVIIFEGAQGMLLDQKWGFQPNTTWSDITFTNAETILRELGYNGPVHKMGVLRSYYTRHGAGYFPSEDDSLKLSIPPELHNTGEEYTGPFRVGNFDLPMALYAIHAIGGVDSLAINHLDVAAQLKLLGVRMSKQITTCVPEEWFVPMLEEMLQVPVSIKGYGPTHKQKEILLPVEKEVYA